ncbi:MAG: hypothetical protein KAR42_05950 [candidate division Zixibacteria bacterium]|nr:hypothetical protein [candidate division Zixibacteria bacterium]
MARRTVYRKRSKKKQFKLPSGKYLRIVLFSLIIVGFSSCYIYLRVWVRALDDEIDLLRDRNEIAERYVSSLKNKWALASSIGAVDVSVIDMKLGLRPTVPTQNLVLRPELNLDENRYTGLLEAFGKIKGNIPIISANEAEANQLFEGQ